MRFEGIIGRRRLLLLGAAAFGAASLLAAFSTSAAMLVVARALLGTPDMKNVDEAITNLRTALARGTTSSTGYRQLAAAYGRKGDAATASGAPCTSTVTQVLSLPTHPVSPSPVARR